MYTVPMTIPQYCNKCPFGRCNYSFPFGSGTVSSIDGKENRSGTYGYVCNVELHKRKRYKNVIRADCGKDIENPDWCGLKEVKQSFA